jgi:hypothetical protein
MDIKLDFTKDLFSNPINRPNTIQQTVILYSPDLPKQPDMKLEKRSKVTTHVKTEI